MSGQRQSSPSLLGEGDRREAVVEGLGQYFASPSTVTLRVPVPLPETSSGRI